jgi:sugar phosphate isomerase/epimerase
MRGNSVVPLTLACADFTWPLLPHDHRHFAYQGIPDHEIESLLPFARHFHVRGGATNRLQTKFQDNTIDYRRIVARLQETGYRGYLAIEYTWQDWQGCNETENVAETIQFRDLLRAALAAGTAAGQ